MGNRTVWAPPTAKPTLKRDEIHVWRALLDWPPGVFELLNATLSPAEATRAARFLRESDRKHFVAARGILRCLLESYLNKPASEIEIRCTSRGKPFVASSEFGAQLTFNLSHSHGIATYAISRGREVGIDVELIQPQLAGDEIAERFFSAKEIMELHSLPPESRAEGFFLCWTRKEAYVKARGEGLYIPLDSFDVSLTPGKAETLRSDDSERWSFRSFRAASDYVAAVVGEGKGWQMRLWEWLPQNAGIVKVEAEEITRRKF